MGLDPTGQVIDIVGSNKFKEEINTQITAIAETPTGGELITALADSSLVIVISESATTSHAQPTDSTAAQDGRGTGGAVEHNPTATPSVNTAQGKVATPPEIVLGHELAHAKDYIKGTLDRTVNPKTGTRRSEEKATETENRLRKEMNLPERLTY